MNGSRPTRHWSGNCVGLALLEVRDDRPQIRLGLRGGDARLQPAEQVHAAHAFDDWPRSNVIGRYTSAPRHMNRFGITPITVRVDLVQTQLTSEHVADRRRTDAARTGSPARRPAPRPACASAAVGVRPRSGGTPITSNVLNVP